MSRLPPSSSPVSYTHLDVYKRQLVVCVGGSYLLGLHFGLGAIGVWLAMVGDWVVRLICFVLRARKKLWLEHR